MRTFLIVEETAESTMHDVGGSSGMGSEQLSGEVRREPEHGSAERSAAVR